MAVLLIFTIIVPTVNKFFNISITSLIPVSSSCLFYYLGGYYIPHWNIPRKFIRALFLLGTACFIASLFLTLAHFSFGIGPDAFFVALYSVGLFTLCADNSRKKSWIDTAFKTPPIASISRYSFGIYLIHPLFLNIIYKLLHLFPDILPIGAGEFCFWFFTLITSWAFIWLLCRCSFFKKLLS